MKKFIPNLLCASVLCVTACSSAQDNASKPASAPASADAGPTNADAPQTCELIGGMLIDGYCLADVQDFPVAPEAKWHTDESGTAWTVVDVYGKTVLVYDGFLPRGFWDKALEFVVGILEPDQIGCSGRYTC